MSISKQAEVERDGMECRLNRVELLRPTWLLNSPPILSNCRWSLGHSTSQPPFCLPAQVCLQPALTPHSKIPFQNLRVPIPDFSSAFPPDRMRSLVVVHYDYFKAKRNPNSSHDRHSSLQFCWMISYTRLIADLLYIYLDLALDPSEMTTMR